MNITIARTMHILITHTMNILIAPPMNILSTSWGWIIGFKLALLDIQSFIPEGVGWVKRRLNGCNGCASHLAGPVAGGHWLLVTGSGLPWAPSESFFHVLICGICFERLSGRSIEW